MKRKFTLGYLFLSLILATAISCSSNDKKEEAVSPDVAEATSETPPPADGTTPPAGDQAAAPPDNAAGAAPTDQAKAPETSEGDMAAQDQTALDQAAAAPPADGKTPPAPDANAAPADPNAAPPTTADANATPADPNAAPAPATGDQQGDLFGAGAGGAAAAAGSDTSATGEAPAPKKSASIQHIKDAPFKKGGQLLNTVYIARDGDTLESISQKLFGEDRSKDLKKANPSLKKGVKTGDKVYFNSPNRPDDKDKLLTVYEDQGLPPSLYTTKEGDTLKSLGQEWYGSEDSYKEIYAINKSLASTKELPAGTELQYWPATATVAVYGAKKEADVAQANNPPPPNNQPPPPPPPTQANNGVPPPPAQQPPMDPNAAGQMNNAPPPPPADLPPPPAPDMNAGMGKHHPKDLGAPGAMDKDTIMYAAAAGVLLIGGGLLVAIRRRNSRRNSGVTQV